MCRPTRGPKSEVLTPAMAKCQRVGDEGDGQAGGSDLAVAWVEEAKGE
jgi:hypothetical protein